MKNTALEKIQKSLRGQVIQREIESLYTRDLFYTVTLTKTSISCDCPGLVNADPDSPTYGEDKPCDHIKIFLEQLMDEYPKRIK